MDKYQKLLVQKARIKEWLYFENNGVSDEESSKNRIIDHLHGYDILTLCLRRC